MVLELGFIDQLKFSMFFCRISFHLSFTLDECCFFLDVQVMVFLVCKLTGKLVGNHTQKDDYTP